MAYSHQHELWNFKSVTRETSWHFNPLLFASTNQAKPSSDWKPIGINDPHVVEIAKFAIKEFNKGITIVVNPKMWSIGPTTASFFSHAVFQFLAIIELSCWRSH